MSEASKTRYVKFGKFGKPVQNKYLKDSKVPPALPEYLAPAAVC